MLILKIKCIIHNIHIWGGVEQHPLKAMCLPRIGSLVLAAIETTAIAYYSVRFLSFHANCIKRRIFKIIASDKEDPAKKILFIVKIIAGTISSLFFGIIVSPEINILLHQKLRLV